jgi:hypothetical protein
VVRFDHGKVSELSLVSPAMENAILAGPANAKGQIRIASK